MTLHRRPFHERATRKLAWVFTAEVLLLGYLMVAHAGGAL